MSKPNLTTSLSEDFNALGMKIDLPKANRMASGRLLNESDPKEVDDEEEDPDEEEPDDDEDDMDEAVAGVRRRCEAEGGCDDEEDEDEDEDEDEEDEDKDEDEDEDEDDDDEIDGPDVTEALLARIDRLIEMGITKDDADEILEALKDKNVPASRRLREHAESTVKNLLDEGQYTMGLHAIRTRGGKFKAMRTKRGKSGFRKVNGRFVAAARAVGGQAKLHKQGIMKKLASLKHGSIWAVKSAIRAVGGVMKRIAGAAKPAAPKPATESILASQLTSVLEDVAVRTGNFTVRDEIMERMVGIMEMLSEEFNDAAVIDVFNGVLESVGDKYTADSLNEDVMSEEEFVNQIQPMLAVITKSLSILESGSGNE